MNTTATVTLRPDQRIQVDRAREVLAAKSGYEPLQMAERIGALEWHVAELLRLVDDLAGRAREAVS